MKPNTHGMPNARYRRRARVKREKLMAAGWLTTLGSPFWKHPRYPNTFFTLDEALTYCTAAEDAKRKAEPA